MYYHINLSPIAIKELEESTGWYENHQVGLGIRFMEAINNFLEILSENPDIYSVKISGFREARIKKFPYLVIYRIIKSENKIRVYHVFHTKRNPKLKRKS